MRESRTMNAESQKVWSALWNSPFSIVIGILMGVGIGIYLKPVARAFAPLGQIYVSLLMMCVLPIIITATTSGLARLMRYDDIEGRLRRLIVYFLLALLVPGAIGALAACLLGPGRYLSEAALDSLGTLALQSNSKPDSASGLLPFLVSVVPANIFESLSKGHIVSILFSCILIGLALGLVQNRGAADIIQFLDVISDSFKLIFHWVLSLLPLGLCFALAGQLANLSLGVFVILLKFIATFYLTAILLGLLYMMTLWYAVGGSFFRLLRALGKPLLLAYMVDSSILALAPSLDALEQRLCVDRRLAGLILPFGLSVNRHGKIFLFAFTAVFIAQLYDIPLGIDGFLVVMIASALSGMAAVGSGVILASSLAVVLHTIAAPDILAPVVLIATGPIVDRLQSAITVLANCTLTALIASPAPGRDRVPETMTAQAVEPEVS